MRWSFSRPGRGSFKLQSIRARSCQLPGQLGLLIDGTREELFEWITLKSIMDYPARDMDPARALNWPHKVIVKHPYSLQLLGFSPPPSKEFNPCLARSVNVTVKSHVWRQRVPRLRQPVFSGGPGINLSGLDGAACKYCIDPCSCIDHLAIRTSSTYAALAVYNLFAFLFGPSHLFEESLLQYSTRSITAQLTRKRQSS